MDELKKNVLYLSYDGMTDPLGQSQVLPYLRGLAKQGYNIHLVSYEKPDKFRRYHRHIEKICDEAGIHWHPQDYVIGGSLLNTIRQVSRMRKITFYLYDKHHFGIVHCRSYIAALAGLRLKRKKGVRFIFDMRGFWADERVDGGLWRLSNPLYRMIYKYFKRKELQFFRESDYTISLTHSGKAEIQSWPKLKNQISHIKVIPCCVDLELFDPEKINTDRKREVRQSLGLDENTYVLGYIGSIGTWYMLSEMLDYFSTLKKRLPDAKFLFVSGEKRESILSEAKSHGLNEADILTTSVLHNEVPAYLSIMDASIFFIRPTFSKKASSPTKQGEIMAMGIPLICNAGVGDTDEIVLKYHSGCVVQHFDRESYESAIPDGNNMDPSETIRGAHEYFSLEEGVKRYLEVYKAVNE